MTHPDQRERDFLASGLSAKQAGQFRLTLDDVVGARTPSAASRARRQPTPGTSSPSPRRLPDAAPGPDTRGEGETEGAGE